MTLSGINWISVVVAIVANMVLGFLWYGPLFGKPWMKLVGKEADEIPQNFSMYLVPILATLLSVIMLWTIKQATGFSGLVTAIAAWVGFIGLTTFTNDLFEGRPPALWLINNTYHLVVFIISGVILDLIG